MHRFRPLVIKFLAFSFVALGLNSLSYSQEWTTGTGSGADKNEAVIDALRNCIRQANGIEIESNNRMQTRFDQVMDNATTDLKHVSFSE